MFNVKIDYNEKIGKIKPMHAVNNGPIPGKSDRGGRENFTAFKAAEIPYVRNHDAAYCSSFGGEHTVDVAHIFTDFDKDPYDPANYDFALTDYYLKIVKDAGSETFYRLGSKIEHWCKKYNTLPPKDFKKWAIICEHIIKHYNEGWADGFYYNLEYWEIWNEADLDPDDALDKRCWGGTAAEFHEFYITVATHLKERFPKLKIGGPALAYNTDWMEGFLQAITKDGNKAPLDFFSWHIYTTSPEHLVRRGEYIRERLNYYGYEGIESILNEWNYLRNWDTEFMYTLKQIKGIKCAAFISACMCAAQNSTIDMLMYYDVSPGSFNGLFNTDTLENLKGYYPFLAFSELYKLGTQVKCTCSGDGIYAISAIGTEGKKASFICYYTDDDSATEKEVEITFENIDTNSLNYLLLDKNYDLEQQENIHIKNKKATVNLLPNSLMLIKNY